MGKERALKSGGVERVGIDIAKNVFQIHGVSASGKALIREKVYREGLERYMRGLSKVRVVMEACGGANHWARVFRGFGHEVSLIAPQFVRPFVKTNKSDRADAEAIVEASMRPGMRYVGVKEVWQQEMLSIHRVRERLVKHRTALMNEVRGLLLEYGVAIAQGTKALKEELFEIQCGRDERLPPVMRELVAELYEELCELGRRIGRQEMKLERVMKEREECRVLKMLDGIGVITATALVATIGDVGQFKNGRQLAAYFGLVPRHEGTGGKTRMKGISKRGDRYIRTLLIHGARVVLRYAKRRQEGSGRDRWLIRLAERRGQNKACVAMANKNARMCFAMLKKLKEGKTPLKEAMRGNVSGDDSTLSREEE